MEKREEMEQRMKTLYLPELGIPQMYVWVEMDLQKLSLGSCKMEKPCTMEDKVTGFLLEGERVNGFGFGYLTGEHIPVGRIAVLELRKPRVSTVSWVLFENRDHKQIWESHS